MGGNEKELMDAIIGEPGDDGPLVAKVVSLEKEKVHAGLIQRLLNLPGKEHADILARNRYHCTFVCFYCETAAAIGPVYLIVAIKAVCLTGKHYIGLSICIACSESCWKFTPCRSTCARKLELKARGRGCG